MEHGQPASQFQGLGHGRKKRDQVRYEAADIVPGTNRLAAAGSFAELSHMSARLTPAADHSRKPQLGPTKKASPEEQTTTIAKHNARQHSNAAALLS